MKVFLILFLLSVLIGGCSKENGGEISGEDQDTTALTKEEVFGINISGELLQLDDEDLQEYLQVEVYPLISGSGKVFASRESSTEFNIFYEDEGKMKIITIRKFYDAVNENIFFERSEPEVLSVDE